MPSFRDGQQNILGIVNPGVYIDQILPTPFVGGLPSNIEGVVGVASWGPVGAPQLSSDIDGSTLIWGPAQIRTYDLMTQILAGTALGSVVGWAGIRVTDGTDTAASAVVQSTFGTATAKYTGSRGNQIQIAFQQTAAIGAIAVVVTFPGRAPERWDGIFQSLASITTVAGTGYTSVPAAVLSAPQKAGGTQAVVQPTLKVVTAALGAGGTGYAVGDKITLPSGVVLTVATVTSGAVATTTIFNAGSLATGSTPTNPVAQASTTGNGTGATFALTWGLGSPTIGSAGSGYTSTPTLTLQGGGGTGGSLTPVISYAAGVQSAINIGNSSRGPSRYIVFSAGAATGLPTLNVPTVLTGGTDGAGGVTNAMMIGQDSLPRTGMYALRKTGVDAFALADVADPTLWATQLAFAISEGTYALTATANGDTIANCVATRQTQAIDDPNIKIIEGDWPAFYDTQNGVTRVVNPAAIALGLFGNLSPEQGTINKPLNGVVYTQTSLTGVLTADADEAQAQTGGIDFIGKSGALGATYFSFMTGRNSSSNTAANGDEYTRLTNYLIRLLQGAATRSIVGKLQSRFRADDPTRAKAKATLDSLFADLANPANGSDGYGMIETWATVCDLTNNTPTTIARGFLFAFCTVGYLNVVRYFVIKLQGGGNVQISVQSTAPSSAQLLAA